MTPTTILPEIVRTAAFLFAAVSACASMFQVCLLLGAPWGEFTLGGRWPGQLPTKVRAIPLVSAVLLGGFAATILSRAGLAFHEMHSYSGSLSWGVVGYCALGCIANAITPSKWERAIWLPVVAVMFATSLVVAAA